ncbi:hypothetical protein AAMO2058_001127300 [Amorphochlora amoebiformis]
MDVLVRLMVETVASHGLVGLASALIPSEIKKVLPKSNALRISFPNGVPDDILAVLWNNLSSHKDLTMSKSKGKREGKMQMIEWGAIEGTREIVSTPVAYSQAMKERIYLVASMELRVSAVGLNPRHLSDSTLMNARRYCLLEALAKVF